jgi:sugar lactone lactonase YvrE
VQEDKPDNRFNDAKCDSSGRLWCGTMGAEEAPGVLKQKQGILFCYSAGIDIHTPAWLDYHNPWLSKFQPLGVCSVLV